MHESRAVVQQKVIDAVRDSGIDLLRRLTQAEREVLGKKIVTKINSANLVGTQLDAFLSALRFPVHCTQGPPGTGKVNYLLSSTSYVPLSLNLHCVTSSVSFLVELIPWSSYLNAELRRCVARFGPGHDSHISP